MNLVESGDLRYQKSEITPIGLPRVSVIIVNYNYGLYLRQAVDSVFAQTYPNIECIIVDNASTDDSNIILEELANKYPSLKRIQRAENGGQSIASVEGFEASTGEYVIFVDADDYLLPCCLVTHVFVHLSLRIPVGFSSGDMLQIVSERMVLGTMTGLSDFVRSGKGKNIGLLRPIDKSTPEAWTLGSPLADNSDVEIENQVHLVEPNNLATWAWAPTSGNCFRRDALQLALNYPRLSELRSCTDAYLLRAISVMMGSVLIDRPLAVYRLHGMNVFSKHPNLNGILTYNRGGPVDNNQLGRKMVILHLIHNAKFFLTKLQSADHLFRALEALDVELPRLPSTVPGCPSYVAGELLSNFAPLADELGTAELTRLLFPFKIKASAFYKAYLKYVIGNRVKKTP